jgi:DNA-binding transcriptional LysR family regulator
MQLELLLTDDVLDLVGDGVDLAIRAGSLADSSLRARKLGESVFRLFASPKYLRRAGAPRSVADLASHRCLHFTTISPHAEWTLRRGAEKKKVAVRAQILSNHLIQLRDLAADGAGIVLMPSFLARDGKSGLEAVLPEWHGEKSSVHVVHPAVPYTPLKVELFIRHLVETFRVPE